jgi:hypothetical protein
MCGLRLIISIMSVVEVCDHDDDHDHGDNHNYDDDSRVMMPETR